MPGAWTSLLAASLFALGGCASAQRPSPPPPAQALEDYVRCLERGDYVGAAEHLVNDGRYAEDRSAIAERLRRAGPDALVEGRRLLEASRRPGALRTVKSRR